MERMTRSSRHYCSAERWRDLKECISICQLSPPFAPSFTQPRQVNGPSGCSKTHSTKPTAESSPGCITLASYWLFCSQTTGWFEWVDGFSLTTGKRVSVSPDKGWTWKDVEHFFMTWRSCPEGLSLSLSNRPDVFRMRRTLWFTEWGSQATENMERERRNSSLP